jgi:hypothetical protein
VQHIFPKEMKPMTHDMTNNPGSIYAVLKGCKCPQIDNHHGRGWKGQPGVFIRSTDCPLHVAQTPRFFVPVCVTIALLCLSGMVLIFVHNATRVIQ